MTTLTIPADVEVTVNAAGRFFRMLDATGTVFARFTDQGKNFPMAKGMAYESGIAWDKIVFKSDTAQRIEFESLLEGKLYDDRFIPGAGGALETIAGTVTYGASTSVSLAAGVATKIADAASGRKQLAIYNPNATQTIYLHNSNLTTYAALGIPPGGTILLNSTQEWWGYNEGAAAIDVWKSEIT